MKPTEGEWRIVERACATPGLTAFEIVSEKGDYIACTCESMSCQNLFGAMVREEAEANARLMAASKRLLEACREAWETLDGLADAMQFRCTRSLQGAIFVATGEMPVSSRVSEPDDAEELIVPEATGGAG